MAIFVGEWRRIGRVGTFGLWPCVLITRRSQVQILPPLLRELALNVLAEVPSGKPGGISHVLTPFCARPTVTAAGRRRPWQLPDPLAAGASAGANAPADQGAPHLHPPICVLGSPLPPGAGVGSRGAAGGTGPFKPPPPPANPRRPDWLPLPWPAPSARRVSPSAAHLPWRCRPVRPPSGATAAVALAGYCARAGAPDQSIPQAATGVAAERNVYAMSTDVRKWVTRKDAAALARCSQDSIVRTEKKHKLQTRTNDAKATLLNTDDLVRVGLIRVEDLAAGGTGAECAELARTKEMVSQLRTEVGRQGGRLAEWDVFLDMLRQQVKEKDHQIRGLQTTIDRLTVAVSSRSAS